MDTVFAIYIILIAISSFTIMFNYSTTFERSDLRLVRLARDAYNIYETNPDAKFPEGFTIEPKICKTELDEKVGHAFVLKGVTGHPALDDFVACFSTKTLEDLGEEDEDIPAGPWEDEEGDDEEVPAGPWEAEDEEEPECEEDDDCGEGHVCENEECVEEEMQDLWGEDDSE